MPNIKAAIVPVTVFQQNCTLLWCTETMKGVIVDPGGDAALVYEGVTKTGIVVEAVWLTHGHLDHAGATQEVAATYGVKIIGPHVGDEVMMEKIPATARSYGLDGYQAARSDQFLNEGDVVNVGNVPFEVLHCPGHSPGSVVYFSPENRFALVGDVLFHGSIGRTDFPGCSHETLIDSIRTKLLILGDDVGFICGHGPGSTIGAEKASNPYIR